MTKRTLTVLALGALVCSGLAASPVRAQSLNYHVLMNTSPLTGGSIGSFTKPFSLDFQFNDGGTPGNNTATLSNFAFGGGSVAGTPSSISGGASGSAGSTVTISDTSFFNELVQSFTPGQSLAFDLNLTTNVDSGPSDAPDEFSFSLVDSSGITITTTAPNSAFVTVDVDSANPTLIAAGSSGHGFTIAAPTVSVTVTPVPEANGTLAGLVGITGLFAVIGLRRVRSRRMSL